MNSYSLALIQAERANAGNLGWRAGNALSGAAARMAEKGWLTQGIQGYWLTTAGKRELARIRRAD